MKMPPPGLQIARKLAAAEYLSLAHVDPQRSAADPMGAHGDRAGETWGEVGGR